MKDPIDGSQAVKCSGCGIAIQTEQPELPGYTPEKAMGRGPVICQRGYRLKTYNEAPSVAVDQADLQRPLSHIGGRSLFILWTCSILKEVSCQAGSGLSVTLRSFSP